jgi:hypothetical protein
VPQFGGLPPPVGGVGEKAFSGYTRPAAVSPYINLYRPTAPGVTNYYSWVRPALDQQALNQRVQGDIQGLHLNARSSATDLRELDLRTQPQPQNLWQPAQFMNFQQYYPNYPGR